eukprot:scaffold5234_cov131-Cylindrotheca_fusiformis.AAC.13
MKMILPNVAFVSIITVQVKSFVLLSTTIHPPVIMSFMKNVPYNGSLSLVVLEDHKEEEEENDEEEEVDARNPTALTVATTNVCTTTTTTTTIMNK